MPAGTKIVSAVSSGVSAWAKTGKVAVVQPDGSPKIYFLKVCDLVRPMPRLGLLRARGCC